MLPGIVKTLPRDLGKCAGPIETRLLEWVHTAHGDIPESFGGGFAIRIQRLAVIEETLIGTIPRVGLRREGVAGVWGSFVMAVDLSWVSTHIIH